MNPYLRVCLFALSVTSAAAEESLTAVMARMKADGLVQFGYRETRFMELLAKPWAGSGVLYAAPPDRMVKLQLQPERIIMVVDGDRMFYYDSLRAVRHSAPVGEGGDLAELIVVMQAVLNGDLSRLREDHRVEFSATGGRWQLKLAPESSRVAEADSFVLVSGPIGGVPDRVVLQQSDGDRSEMALRKLAAGERLKDSVELLIEEAEGR